MQIAQKISSNLNPLARYNLCSYPATYILTDILHAHLYFDSVLSVAQRVITPHFEVSL